MTSLDIAPFADAPVLGASIRLIAAVGLTIIYGTVGVIDMAHGEFIMLGADTAYALQSFLGLPFLLCLPASFAVAALIGLAIERGLIRDHDNRTLDTRLAIWGVSLVPMQGVRLIYGSDPKCIAVPEMFQSNVEVGFASLSVS